MKELLNNPGFIALLGTLFGGAGLEFVRRLMDRKQRATDEASKIREELRKEIDGLRLQLTSASTEEQRLESEIERWKGLYYDQKEEYLRTITDLQILTERLKTIQPQESPLDNPKPE